MNAKNPTSGVVAMPSTSLSSPSTGTSVAVARNEVAVRRRLHGDLDNVRAAVTWALDRDEPDDQELALRILVALVYEVTMDRSTEYGTWAEEALRRVTRWPHGVRSVILGAASHGAFHRSDFTTALQYAEASVDELVPMAPGLAHPAGPRWVPPRFVFVGRQEEAVRMMEDAIRLFDAAGAGDYERWNLQTVLLTFQCDHARSRRQSARSAEESPLPGSADRQSQRTPRSRSVSPPWRGSPTTRARHCKPAKRAWR